MVNVIKTLTLKEQSFVFVLGKTESFACDRTPEAGRRDSSHGGKHC